MMVRNYKPRHGTVRKKSYTDEAFQEALRRVSDGESVNKVSREMGIPRRSLRDRIGGARPTNVIGRPRALLPEEEDCIASHAAALSDFGYAFDKTELRYFVKSYLDKACRNVVQFTDNLPGIDWVDAYMKRHVQLTHRVCQNIGRKRAAVSVSEVDNFFDNLSVSLEGIPPENIVNYDETNLDDNPKGIKLIFRKGINHAERVMNVSKTSISIMFACSATGRVLAPYVVYKGERLMDNWVLGGPVHAIYNRSKSGWFDNYLFTDWFKRVAVPYFRRLPNEHPRVIIGDNLSAHFGAEILQICEAENIRYLFLPPNSTGILQPLDVAVYGPMKRVWREVLTDWKKGQGKHYTALPKHAFPGLLYNLLEGMENFSELAKSGFRACGIYPLNRNRIIAKLKKTPANSPRKIVSPLVIDHLRKLREDAAQKPQRARAKRIQVEPGKSVTVADLQASTSGTPSRKPPAKKIKRASRRLVHKSSESDVDDPSEQHSLLDESDNDPIVNLDPAEPLEIEEFRFEKGDFVLMRYPGRGKNKDYHFIGTLLNLIEPENVAWDVRYFRKVEAQKVMAGFLAFKEPDVPDITVTPTHQIILKLDKPERVKRTLFFKDIFSAKGLIMR